ncbi:MAG TPA: hypothetical protein VF719_05830 [Abditibacteriaceae bacterium]|jgi:hypothetical protein
MFSGILIASHATTFQIPMKYIAFILALLILAPGTAAFACTQCRPGVKAGVYDENFGANLFVLFLPLVALLTIAWAIHHWDTLVAKLNKSKGAATCQKN